MNRHISMLLLVMNTITGSAESLKVIAANTMIADIARQVAGPAVQVESLLPYGADPHAFQPVPKDMQRLLDADLVLVNGLGLEGSLQAYLDRVPESRRVVVSSRIKARTLSEGCSSHDEHDHEHAHGEDCSSGGLDPHVWFVPLHVASWADVIADALGARDPAGKDGYRERADHVTRSLRSLDEWAERELAAIPPGRRKIVSDHAAFGYFAERYRFEVVGSVLSGFSTSAETPARELAQLFRTIKSSGIDRIFAEPSARVSLAARIASDAGVTLVELPACALGPPGSPVSSYDAYFRHLVRGVAGEPGP